MTTHKCIIKNMSQQFWQGIDGVLPGFNNLSPKEAYEKLANLSRDLPKNISFENKQFNHMVELNQVTRGEHTVELKVEPRRGYKLATFTFTAG